MKYKLKIKKYTIEISDEVSWEEKYKKLEAHHLEETKELISRVEVLERYLEEIYGDDLSGWGVNEWDLF